MSRPACVALGVMLGALVMPLTSAAYHLIRYRSLINPT